MRCIWNGAEPACSASRELKLHRFSRHESHNDHICTEIFDLALVKVREYERRVTSRSGLRTKVGSLNNERVRIIVNGIGGRRILQTRNKPMVNIFR
jgi:hypothetical protein